MPDLCGTRIVFAPAKMVPGATLAPFSSNAAHGHVCTPYTDICCKLYAAVTAWQQDAMHAQLQVLARQVDTGSTWRDVRC